MTQLGVYTNQIIFPFRLKPFIFVFDTEIEEHLYRVGLYFSYRQVCTSFVLKYHQVKIEHILLDAVFSLGTFILVVHF
jgi:hypothetical protein